LRWISHDLCGVGLVSSPESSSCSDEAGVEGALALESGVWSLDWSGSRVQKVSKRIREGEESFQVPHGGTQIEVAICLTETDRSSYS
jgi:hypothetical protein